VSDRGEFLEKPELRRLTGCAWATAQAAWLKERGIPHRLDGKRLIVCRVHVRAWVEGRQVVSSNGPNWSAMPKHA
jgi:hypothetical protein